MSDIKGVGKDQASMPDPDHPAKPDGPTDMSKRSWKYVGRKVMREFSEDQCTDQAAGLTYYAVLAIFPAMLALLSMASLFMDAQTAVSKIEGILRPLVSDQTLDTFTPVLESLASSQGAGLTLVIGLLGALWSASGYVGAFGRAMNRVYEIDEGRPFWKLRPLMLLITLVAVVLSALVLVMLVVSGPLAESIGNTIGLGSAAVTAWQIAKWPVLLVMVMIVVAVLYYATPNVKQPKFKWISVGAAFAIVIWVQAGIPAEEELQLPARDTRNIEKAREKEQKDIEMGRSIREQADPDGEVAAQYGDSTTGIPDQSAGRTDDATGAGSSTSTSPGRN
jgi:membrane protein